MILNKLKEIFKKMGIYEEVSESTMLSNDLFMDSTEITNLRCCIMNEFKVDITSKELTDNSLKEIIKIIQKNIESKEADKND